MGRRQRIEVSWTRIEELVRKSFLGGTLTEEERDYIYQVHDRHPEEYAAVSNKARETARADYRRSLGGR